MAYSAHVSTLSGNMSHTDWKPIFPSVGTDRDRTGALPLIGQTDLTGTPKKPLHHYLETEITKQFSGVKTTLSAYVAEHAVRIATISLTGVVDDALAEEILNKVFRYWISPTSRFVISQERVHATQATPSVHWGKGRAIRFTRREWSQELEFHAIYFTETDYLVDERDVKQLVEYKRKAMSASMTNTFVYRALCALTHANIMEFVVPIPRASTSILKAMAYEIDNFLAFQKGENDTNMEWLLNYASQELESKCGSNVTHVIFPESVSDRQFKRWPLVSIPKHGEYAYLPKGISHRKIGTRVLTVILVPDMVASDNGTRDNPLILDVQFGWFNAISERIIPLKDFQDQQIARNRGTQLSIMIPDAVQQAYIPFTFQTIVEKCGDMTLADAFTSDTTSDLFRLTTLYVDAQPDVYDVYVNWINDFH